MKNIDKLIISITFFILLFSCREEMILDESLLKPKIVVSTFLTPDQAIYIELFRDISFYRSYIGANEIPDAKILLYENDEIINEFEQHSYIYSYSNGNGESFFSDTVFYLSTSNVFGKAGKTYHMEIESATYGNLSCETTIPYPIDTFQIKTEFKKTDNAYGTSYLNSIFKIRINDPVDEKNYYRLIIQEGGGSLSNIVGDSLNSTIYVSSVYSPTRFYTEDPIFFYEKENANRFVVGETDNSFGIFTDELFNGMEYELTVNTVFNSAYIDTTAGEFIQYAIIIQTISEEMYLYLKSIDQQEIMYAFPFSEPIPIYSNVVNGAGIFGSYSEKTIYSGTFGQYPKVGIEYKDIDYYSR